MQFCHELSDRQSARVIEQAISQQVPVRIDPHHSCGLVPFSAQMVSTDGDQFTFRILEETSPCSEALVPGLYCQAEFSVGGSPYLLNIYLTEIHLQEHTLCTNRPKLVQVLERRKFMRAQTAPATTITVQWPAESRQALAKLFNIAGGGLAFRIDNEMADYIAIGDVLEAQFELTGLPNRFAFPINICNKTLASDEQSVIVGAQFQESGPGVQAGDLDELRRFLAAQQQASLSR